MSDDFALFANRHVILAIFAVDPLLATFRDAANVDEEFRFVEILAIPGELIHLHERQFDLFMTRNVLELTFVRTVALADQIEKLAVDVQESVLARRALIRDRRFRHVSRAVELVHIRQIRPLLFRLDQGEVAHQVSVVLLRLGEVVDPFVGLLLKLGIRMRGEGVREAFDDLVDVGVVEEDSLKFALLQSSGDLEVVDAPRFSFAPLDVVGNGNDAVCFDTRGPEPVVELHVGKGDGAHRLFWLLDFLSRGGYGKSRDASRDRQSRR